MITAYSYCRFSSGEQAKGTSLERQKRSQELIKSKGWQLDTTLQMEDLGVSAYKKKNLSDVAALGSFLEAIKQKKIKRGSVLVVEHLDRLTRAEVTVATEVFLQIINAGVSIISLTPAYREYNKKEIDAQPFLMMELVMGFIASHEYSKNIQRRVKASWEIRRANHDNKPITGKIPCWLQLDKATGKFSFVSEKVAIIKRVLKLVNDGYGSARITRLLNSEGLPTISVATKKANKQWAAAFVVQLISNPALYGAFRPATYQDEKRVETGEEWPDYFPAIITKEQFQRLIIQRKGRAAGRNGKKAEDTANLFQGLIRTVDGEKWHKIKKNIPRIAPASFRDGTTDQLSFPFEPLENFLLNILAIDISLADIGSEVESPISLLDTLKVQLSELETKIAKLQDAYKNSPDSDLLIQMAISLSADKTKLLTAIEAEESKVVSRPVDEIAEIKSMLKDSSKPIVRAKLKLIISRLVKEIRMVVVGTRRSPCKAAELQIYFRAGGTVSCAIACEADRVLTTTKTRDFPSFVDFRMSGERLNGYLKLRERFYLATFQQYFDKRCNRPNDTDPVGDFFAGFVALPK